MAGAVVTLTMRHAALIVKIARELDVEARALRALLEVEAGGEGLLDGRPIVRLEVHHLWRAVPQAKRAEVDKRFVVRGPKPWQGHEWRPTEAGAWVALHRGGADGQRAEWSALQLARSIDEAAAIESTSWGAGQLLGKHWRALGYRSATAFAEAMHSEAAQLQAMGRYLEEVARLVPALRVRDWEEVARRYNGPGQVDWYAGELAEAYAVAR